MGALPPRYAFVLNPYPRERFTRCPRCKARTHARKIALVIHVTSVGLVTLRKTCRLCIVCDMLIAHQAEIDRLIDGFRSGRAERREYLVLGTLESRTWRQGVSGSVTVEEVVAHMADLKAHVRIDYESEGCHRSSEAPD